MGTWQIKSFGSGEILLVQMQGDISVDDMNIINADLIDRMKHMSDQTLLVHIIVDSTKTDSLPRPGELQKVSEPLKAQVNRGFIVSITHNPIFRFFGNLVLKSDRTRLCNDYTEASEYLQVLYGNYPAYNKALGEFEKFSSASRG